MSHDPLVIDLSHHNSVASFEDVRAAGIVGVIHKATEGTGFSDSEYWDRREAAKQAGLEWASYHFLKHGDIALQMENFLQKVQPEPGERLVIDHEDEDVTLDDLRDAILELQINAPQCELTVYSGHTIKEQLGQSFDPLLATTSLWIAHYTDAAEPTWPTATWPVWTLWQYTDTGFCPGINGACDLNNFNGSVEACHAWFNAYAEPTEPDIVRPTVRVEVITTPGVEVTVVVNGTLFTLTDE
jgi:lysozyme